MWFVQPVSCQLLLIKDNWRQVRRTQDKVKSDPVSLVFQNDPLSLQAVLRTVYVARVTWEKISTATGDLI